MGTQPVRIGGNDRTLQADNAADNAADRAMGREKKAVIKKTKHETTGLSNNTLTELNSVARRILKNPNSSTDDQSLWGELSGVFQRATSQEHRLTLVNELKIKLKKLKPKKYGHLETRATQTAPLPGVKKQKQKENSQERQEVIKALKKSGYLETFQKYLSGNLNNAVKQKIKLNPAVIKKIVEKSDGKLTTEQVENQLSQLQNLNLSRENLSTKAGQQGIENILGGLIGAGEHEGVAPKDIPRQSNQMLTEDVDGLDMKVKSPEGEIFSLTKLSQIVSQHFSENVTFDEAGLNNILIDNFSKLFDSFKGQKKLDLKTSKTGNGAKDAAVAAANLGELFKSLKGGGNTPLSQLSDVFDLGPGLSRVTDKASFMVLVKEKVGTYTKALGDKFKDPEFKKQYLEAQKSNPNLTPFQFAKENAKVSSQQNIEKNLKSIPEYQLGTPEARKYADFLANGGDMSFPSFVDQRLLPKMHPLMRLFYMLKTVLASFGITLGKEDKRTAKQKMEDLKKMAGVKTPEELAVERKMALKNKEFKEFFESPQLWKNVKITDDVDFDLNEKGQDKNEEAKNERLDYFHKNKGAMEKFKKLLDLKVGIPRELLSKGLTLKTLEGIHSKKEQFIVNGDNLEIKDSNKKIIKTIKLSEVTDEKLQEALGDSNAASKGEKILEKAGKSKDDIKGIDSDLKVLLGQENIPTKKEDAEKLVERGEKIITFIKKKKLDPNIKISDLKELFSQTGGGFNKEFSIVLGAKMEQPLNKASIKLIKDNFESKIKDNLEVKNGILNLKDGMSLIGRNTSFNKFNDFLGYLSGEKTLDKKYTDPDETPKPKSKQPEVKTGAKKSTLTEEQKTKATELIRGNPKKLKGIKSENIPAKLLEKNGEPKALLKSLLALDDKFFKTPLTEENLKTIADKKNELSGVIFEDVGWEANKILSGKNPFAGYFKAKNLKIGDAAEAAMTFKNITEFIATIDGLN